MNTHLHRQKSANHSHRTDRIIQQRSTAAKAPIRVRAAGKMCCDHILRACPYTTWILPENSGSEEAAASKQTFKGRF